MASRAGPRAPGRAKAEPRQVIGKRRAPSRSQARGLVRRKQLIDAGLELLASVPVEELSFRQVCERAGMPEGSGYHFYANKYDLLTALAGTLSQKFIDSLPNLISNGPPKNWEDLADRVVENGAEVYRANPAAIQLFLGARTPPEVKLEDRTNDRLVSASIREIFDQYFVMPPIRPGHDLFFYFIEITDLMFSLSVLDEGRITPEMIEESKQAGKGYLRVYLPPHLSPKVGNEEGKS